MDEGLSSGFFGEDFAPDTRAFTEVKEFYCSGTGYTRLHLCRRLGRLHILKSLKPEYASQEFYKQLLLKEFNISYPLEHLHIRQTLGMEQHEELGTVIVMEYVDGSPLSAFMEAGKLSKGLAYKFIAEICSALQYIHGKQLIHKDLKPNNILVTYNGNNVKLIDFGLADCDDYEMLKIPAGTKKYLAPEQLIPGATLDARTDIYSLGVIIREMADILKDGKLAAIARKCMQEQPAKRYGSVAEVAEALKKKRPRVVYKVAVAIAVVGLVVGGLLYYLVADPLTASPVEDFPEVYSNTSTSDVYRKALREERQRLLERAVHFAVDREALVADSLRVDRRLREVVNARYPDSLQRQGAAYRQAMRLVEKDVADLVADVRRRLR